MGSFFWRNVVISVGSSPEGAGFIGIRAPKVKLRVCMPNSSKACPLELYMVLKLSKALPKKKQGIKRNATQNRVLITSPKKKQKKEEGPS
jgi:hypothetical protein